MFSTDFDQMRNGPDGKIYMHPTNGTKAIHIIEQNMDKVVLTGLAMNPAARHLLIKIEDILDVNTLYANPAMIDIILANVNKIDWEYFSINTAPEAIELLIQNPKKIYWLYFSANPAAIQYIKKMKDYIICIPSYKRAQVCNNKTLTTLEKNNIPASKIYVYVANQEEYTLYKEKLDPKLYHQLIVHLI
jgi:hypothetical protein